MTTITHATLAATLEAAINAGDIQPRDIDFARSLLAGFAKWRSFTPRQEPHVIRLITPAAAPAQPTLADVSGILRLLNRAKARGLKRPGFTLKSAASELRLSLAPDTGKNPGYVYVKVDGAYAGKIAPDGKLTTNTVLVNIPLLSQMAADPAATAASHGHQTGACCFCSRSLDDPRSVAVGYGPVCADKYELPYGV